MARLLLSGVIAWQCEFDGTTSCLGSITRWLFLFTGCGLLFFDSEYVWSGWNTLRGLQGACPSRDLEWIACFLARLPGREPQGRFKVQEPRASQTGRSRHARSRPPSSLSGGRTSDRHFYSLRLYRMSVVFMAGPPPLLEAPPLVDQPPPYQPPRERWR